MKALLDLLRDLMLFRRGPQDLPFSPALLAATALVTFAIEAAVMAQVEGDKSIVAPLTVSIAIELALTWIVLRSAGLANRFAQAATGLMATRAAFTLLTFPMVFGIGPVLDPEKATDTQILLAWLLLPFVFWKLAVMGHVLRHALDRTLRSGVLIALGFVAVQFLVVTALFGPSAAA